MSMITTAALMVKAMKLPPIDAQLYDLPEKSFCVMTGEEITQGYKVMDITTTATNEYLDTFGGHPTGYVAESVGRCFKLWNVGAIAVFLESDAYYHPLFSPISALEQGRHCWRDMPKIISEKHKGELGVIILTSNTKKRFWQFAKIGIVGALTPVFVGDSGVHKQEVVYVDFERLQEALALVQKVRAAGFESVKDGRAYPILEGLLEDYATVLKIGLPKTLELEAELAEWRNTDELVCAAIIESHSMKDPSKKGDKNTGKKTTKKVAEEAATEIQITQE